MTLALESKPPESKSGEKNKATSQHTNLVSLDVLKLQLINNSDFKAEAGSSVSLGELVEYLVESLEEADAATANRAENLLVRIGQPSVPYLLKGLKSSSVAVKSVCAMALIRIGQPAVEGLRELYVRVASRTQFKKHKWVVAFVLTELGESLPAIDTVEMDELPPINQPKQSSAVSELSKAG